MPTWPANYARGNEMQNVYAAAAIAAIFVTSGGQSVAQDVYPSKSIRVIVPLSAGSAADIIPRLVYEQVGQQVGQSIVIENRVGAGGTIGVNAVAKADPDGYTILAHSNGHTMAPAFFNKLPYDVGADFAGITPLGNLPHVLVIAQSQNIKTLQELVTAGKTRPDGITYGAVLGTAPHLNAEHFRQTMKVPMRPVPFRGAPEALTEVLTARVDIYFSPITPALPFIADGKMVALAVTNAKRSQALPEVATTFEQGYPNSQFGLWIGSWLPAKTPPAIVARLHAETIKALATPKVIAKFKEMGIEPFPMQPAAFDAFVLKEVESNAELAHAAAIAKQ